MTLAFEIKNVTVTEFGVGRGIEHGRNFSVVPVHAEVQAVLYEMVQATWNSMQKMDDEGPVAYQPSENYRSTEYLRVSRSDGLDKAIRELHEAENLPIDAKALDDPNNILCYFARFLDDQGKRLTALRRASQFKGVLRKKLLRFESDSLKIVEDDVFKLDSDFDLLIDSEQTYILRPNAFEALCDLKQAILDAVPGNVASLKQNMSFMDLSPVQSYASTHSRAARCLASIRRQNLTGITREALENLCRSTGVELQETNGMVTVADREVVGFLEVLDRRRYQVELVPDTPERFRAASRRKIDG